MNDTWNPTQYAKFQREREQPFSDLLGLIRPVPFARVVDLGCGTGSLTRLLHEALRPSETLGTDRSPRMLEAASAAEPLEGLRFEVGTIESFSGTAQYDLIFSNAAFHWVADHEGLIRRLATALRPGGQLAFQVPAMHQSPPHALADAVAGSNRFRAAFGGWQRPQPVLEPDEYSRLLFRAGFPDPRVRLVIYPHVLASRDEVLEWMRGTLLTGYEKRLGPGLWPDFLAAYRERLLDALPDERPFFFPFKRILCWGRKPES